MERCWTGRDLLLLLRCFSGQGRLTPTKKVAFRVMSQMADVLGGRPQIVDFGSDVTLQVDEYYDQKIMIRLEFDNSNLMMQDDMMIYIHLMMMSV